MAVVPDFVLDKAFEAVYVGVQDLIVKNFIFKSLFNDVRSRLDDLAPLIKEMAQYNQKMGRPEKELEALKGVMEKGQELVNKCSTITRWSPFKKYKYARKLLQWQESLKTPLEKLKVQESMQIMKIDGTVDDIHRMMLKQQPAESSSSTRLELPPLPRLIVGLDGPLNDLKKKLLADDGVSRLVLTAPGGCGKTTLATMFCQDEEVKGKVKDNIIFITVSQKGNLELVVKRLCESESSPVPTFQNKVHMLQWMQTFFKGRQNPLLLVLDDIWSGSSESILHSFQFESSNYKILVTSRSEFPDFGSSYPLKLLDDDKAMKLFYHSASLGDKCSPEREELSRKIVKRCNGFPLAITVVGRSLSGQPIEVWRKRVSEWSKDSCILDAETELFLCLQSSLDALDKRLAIVKDCYLDLGSFPEDKEIRVDDLIDMWAELYDIDDDSVIFANVYELANRNLANLVDKRRSDMKMEGDDFYGQRFVTQHDLLRELAIYNAKLDPVEQRKRMNIEIRGKKIPKWWREQECHPIKARLLSITTTTDFDMEWPNLQLPEAEVFVLHFQSPSRYSLPAFVQKMDKLKVLVIDGGRELINFELLGLLPNLKRISLIRLRIGFLTHKPIQLKSLKKISFKSCDAEGIGKGVFRMSDAFRNLEELNYSEEFRNVGYRRHLNSEEFLVECCNLIHLKKISISFGRRVTLLLDFIAGLRDFLPEEIGNLVNLEVLRLRSCIFLSKLPSSISNLKKLNFLDISECVNIELPKNIGELSSLRKVDMRNCYSVKELPPSVSDLHQLEEVICNREDKGSLWEPFLPTLTNLRVVVIPRTQRSLLETFSDGWSS
ncbi:probable disease resistance protein At5g66900 [Rosa rugosa]|uniref:probable disease resistance protein At5g66900 n=1 Tax=Rosa rugosa TaxID=74645 RepID=UPI002B40101B|nr:probable disease resistance protein At5g66900 [Rosa rugosa]XP_062010051.1 probable disease resistance protein At5g66900 [Rosa rugosa]